jgi:D-threonate/D-erythronate kinase
MKGADFKVIIIADDLTGANDTGVQIAKRGLETVTVVDPSLVGDTLADGIVLDTESRTLPTGEARAAVREAARTMRSHTNALLYKKIDSTLRGHIGAELDALIRELDPERVVCAPAYPKNRRTTRNGIHLLRGVPIDRTEVAGDPRNPVDTASLPAVLAKDGGPRFRHVDLGALRAGQAGNLAEDRFLSFDCEEQEDLKRIVRVMGETGKRILWCGSAGLAEVILEEYFPGSTGEGKYLDSKGQKPLKGSTGGICGDGPILSVIGSRSNVSLRQVQNAIASTSAHVVRLDTQSLIDSPAREHARIVRELEDQVTQTDHLILTSIGTETDPPSAGLAGGYPSQDAFPELVARFLADATAEFTQRNRITGMFLTGGDTAIHILRAAGARGLRLESELEAGVPATRLIGGFLDGLPVVTKGGGFGDEETLVRSARYLASQSRDAT